jgi:hypothetical protein
MEWRDLRASGQLGLLYAAARWGSQWYPGPAANHALRLPIPSRPPRTSVSLPKLRHDIDQFCYLRDRGLLDSKFEPVIDDYREVAGSLANARPEVRVPLEGDIAARIGHVYNRIVHMPQPPRIDNALSRAWDPADVEDRYLHQPPGLVVIDDFLSPWALDQIRRFCMEATVFSGTRYPEGRLGAFFIDGFNAPLLLQVAEDLRAALPRVIGDRHALRQMWAFKYAPTSGRQSSTHADFAAVNVNLWITPTAANLDRDSGGLIVYDTAAPLSWDFSSYNQRPDMIDGYLRNRGAHATTIPYRENRAVVFNSDLFHATAPIRFRSEYQHRRVNLTFLFGDRTADRHHPSMMGSPPIPDTAAWRSAALKRARR